MDPLYLSYTILGVTVLLLAFAAEPIKCNLWLSAPLLALAVGTAVGPNGFNLLDPAQWGDQTVLLEELAYLTLAVSLMGIAFRLPDRWVRRKWRPLTVILLVGMPGMWLVSGLSSWFIFDLPVLEALLLGALITPTDPVVADSIVTGELAETHIDADARHLISAESGANDGLAYILVMLPVLLLEQPVPDALREWFLIEVLAKVCGAIIFGILAGYLAARCLDYLYSIGRSQRESILTVTLALALALLGLVKLLHGDGILAVFAAGLTLNWVIRSEAGHEEAQHERMQQTINEFLEVPVFMLFGMVMPVNEWLAVGPVLLIFAVTILLLRRVPVILLLRSQVSALDNRREALFVGWFGPIGVAAIVYGTWAEVRQGYEMLWTISSFVIFLSILIHGITATPLTRLYGRYRKENSA